MKLNADIICIGLKNRYNAQLSGPKTNEMTLSRPEVWQDSSGSFRTGHLYLASADHLPLRPHIQKGAVLVCIGESIHLNYLKSRLCLITLERSSDFFEVLKTIHEIFDLYDEWERKIYTDLFEQCDAGSIIRDSDHIFRKPIYVLDRSFRIIAASEKTEETWAAGGSDLLNADSMSRYLSAEDLMTERRNAIRIDLFAKRVTAVNLFSKSGEYEGCVCIEQKEGDFSDAEDRLAEKLAEFISMAAEKNPQIINDSSENLKKVLHALLEEMPLSHQQRMLLTSMEGRSCCLVCMRYSRQGKQLPLSYISGIFEDRFEGSCAFEYDDCIAAVIPAAPLRTSKNSDFRIMLNRKLSEFLPQMGLQAGISNEFSSLLKVRINYLQAVSALENGSLISPTGYLYYFESFALAEMIINSLGGLPLETYYPAGFRQLLEHDMESDISWLETVKTFLEENLSYTAASRKLYIHRSTLIDRISRIEKELGIDLKDPDRRLQLEMLIKAIELEEMLKMQ